LEREKKLGIGSSNLELITVIKKEVKLKNICKINL
jgi:hypothetical protein